MADIWTTPGTWNNEVLADGKLNTNMRDNPEALFNGLTGDTSSDADIKHAHKTGTLAARPAASKAGRIYYTTDTFETFMDTGTAWRHMGGPGAYDTFVRAASATITPSKSGHTWAEPAGTWDIVAGTSPPVNDLRQVGGPTTAIATLDTGSLLDRAYTVQASFITNTTQASIDAAVICKFLDASNMIYVQLLPSALQIHSIGGVGLMSSSAFTPAANTYYSLKAVVYGDVVSAVLSSQFAFACQGEARNADVTRAGLATATKVGFRTPNTVERFASIAVTF